MFENNPHNKNSNRLPKLKQNVDAFATCINSTYILHALTQHTFLFKPNIFARYGSGPFPIPTCLKLQLSLCHDRSATCITEIESRTERPAQQPFHARLSCSCPMQEKPSFLIPQFDNRPVKSGFALAASSSFIVQFQDAPHSCQGIP